MLVTYGHNLSDFVSFLLFWRSGCQTLPWCQSRKCCEHYCDPADCSDWRSGKKKSLFCLFLQFFSLISLTLNRPCSINTVIVTVSSFYRVCTLTCSQWITDVRGVSELQYFMWLPWLTGREKRDYSPYGHHFRWKMCSGIFPQGASIEDFYMRCTCVCMCDGRNRVPSQHLFFFYRGHSGSLHSIRSKKQVFMSSGAALWSNRKEVYQSLFRKKLNRKYSHKPMVGCFQYCVVINQRANRNQHCIIGWRGNV